MITISAVAMAFHSSAMFWTGFLACLALVVGVSNKMKGGRK